VPGVSEGCVSEGAIDDSDAVDERRLLFTELAGNMLGSVTSIENEIVLISEKNNNTVETIVMKDIHP
jgi:hypothetical protein